MNTTKTTITLLIAILFLSASCKKNKNEEENIRPYTMLSMLLSTHTLNENAKRTLRNSNELYNIFENQYTKPSQNTVYFQGKVEKLKNETNKVLKSLNHVKQLYEYHVTERKSIENPFDINPIYEQNEIEIVELKSRTGYYKNFIMNCIEDTVRYMPIVRHLQHQLDTANVVFKDGRIIFKTKQEYLL